MTRGRSEGGTWSGTKVDSFGNNKQMKHALLLARPSRSMLARFIGSARNDVKYKNKKGKEKLGSKCHSNPKYQRVYLSFWIRYRSTRRIFCFCNAQKWNLHSMFLIMSFQKLLSILLPDDKKINLFTKDRCGGCNLYSVSKEEGAWQKFGNNSAMMFDKYNTIKLQHNL